MIQEFLLKIRRRENAFYNGLYRTAFGLRRMRLPLPRALFVAIYYLSEFVSAVASILHRVLWADPLFRSRCTSVGQGLFLVGGVPCIHGRLAIYIGDNVTLYGRSTIDANQVHELPILRIGDNTYLGDFLRISVGQEVTIGRHCYVSDRVYIADHDGHPIEPEKRRRREQVAADRIRPVVIEDDVWIGRCSIILKGVRIGYGAVVGAGSVITSDVPPLTVYCGNPARLVKRL